MGVKNTLAQKAKILKREIGTLYYAAKHKDTPLIAKVITVIVVGYALSPIDLIPDFIPILGYLDDIILLPLGIAFAIKLIPSEVIEESREKAVLLFEQEKKKSLIAGLIIIIIWLLLLMLIIMKII